jgi:hypothetical protein
MLTCILVVSVASAPAGENGGAARSGPLAGLPSRPGPHIGRIRALKDGEWLELGQPKPDPKWGVGRGRSWCQKMNFAADLRGAYYTGEGVHAYIKPDGHYMDDHFFYDINAHAWICLHPGVKAGADQGLKIGQTGLLVNKDGDPIPCGLLAHNYDQTTYDSHQKKFAFIPKGGSTGWWITMKCKQVKELQKPAWARMQAASKVWSPWYFNTQTGKFEREPVKGGGPTSTGGGGCFTYLPKHRKFFLKSNSKIYTYTAATKTWAAAARLPVLIGGDTVSCYDSKRGLLYLAGGNKKEANGTMLAYDAGANTWTKLPNITDNPRFTGNSGHMTYDSAGDVVVCNVRGIKKVLAGGRDHRREGQRRRLLRSREQRPLLPPGRRQPGGGSDVGLPLPPGEEMKPGGRWMVEDGRGHSPPPSTFHPPPMTIVGGCS